MDILAVNNDLKSEYFNKDDIISIVSKHNKLTDESFIATYNIRNASDKMLGFLCDYWKLQVRLGPNNIVLQYFIKVMSLTNTAKAEMVKELGLFKKELYFYSVVKRNIDISGSKPWGAGFVTELKNAMIFEDMNALNYKLRDKFRRFDMAHTLEALRTLARFHASTIIYEDRHCNELKCKYMINREFYENLEETGYVVSNNWYIKCMDAGLQAIKLFSKYTKEELETIEGRWNSVWLNALELGNASTEYRNVICHQDLWNNNLMFRYKDNDNMEPDHCILVDFQAARYQPPAGDVMLLLYCNLDPNFREENIEHFLDFYYSELSTILNDHGLKIASTITKEEFLETAAKQRQWAMVVCSCLIQHFWVDNDLTTKMFGNATQFDDIFNKNKAKFVIKMMHTNSSYKENVLAMFEEIVKHFCLC